jgi:hypothetical protein
VQHVGDPPITDRSVYRVRRLSREAFRILLETATNTFGAVSSPEWVVPVADRSKPDHIDALMKELLPPIDPDVGYMRAGSITCSDNEVIWVNARDAARLETLQGETLWARLNPSNDH